MLNTDQVDYIRKTLLRRGIETTDLLEEMTDHFVEAIEEREGELRHTPLRELLRQEVAKFGPFGMMNLQQEYQIKLEKQGMRIFWRTFKSFWRIPQIIASLAFFFVIYAAISTFQQTATETLKIIIFSIAVLHTLIMLYFRFGLKLGQLAMFTKLYVSVYWINIPILSMSHGLFYQATSTEPFSFQSQLIATLLLGTYLLAQIAAGTILFRSVEAVKEVLKTKRV